VIRRAAGAEVQSAVDRAQAAVVESHPAIARGADGTVLASREVVVLISLPKRGTELASNVVIRGVGAAGVVLRPQVHLVETSPALRAEQAARVPGAVWHDSVATLPEGPLFLVANEFLDALPIRQFVRAGPMWRERMVGVEGERLVLGLAPPAPVPALAHRMADTRDGDIVEHCPALDPIVGEVGRRVAGYGGLAVFVDYGDWRSAGDTLQAMKGHAYADPLAAPGEADLTAHVDFEAIARAALPAKATAMVTQGTLLRSLGIEARAAVLGRNLTGEAQKSHLAALDRLTDPGQMGHLFKAMGLYPPGAPLPPGFAA